MAQLLFLQKIFDTLIDSFIKDKVGIAENFLSVALATDLKLNLLSLFANHQLHFAGTGNKTPDQNTQRHTRKFFF